MKTPEQIRADVLSDWTRDVDRATIKRRHPKTAADDEACIEAEIKMRLALQCLPDCAFWSPEDRRWEGAVDPAPKNEKGWLYEAEHGDLPAGE